MALKGGDVGFNAVSTTLVTTAETVMVSVGPIDVPADSVRAYVSGFCGLNTGTGVTTLTAKIRRGLTTSDPLVGVAVGVAAGASAAAQVSAEVMDVLTGAATVSYCLTVSQGGATGNGSGINSIIAVLFM